jgi:copper oxidase (laccase) domain-containing protein
VHDAFAAAGHAEEHLSRWSSTNSEGSLALDLWTANRDQLMTAGVREDRIYVSGLCTETHRDVFESYRVDGPKAGRLLALVAVPH